MVPIDFYSERYVSQKGLIGGSAEMMLVLLTGLIVLTSIIGFSFNLYKTANATAEWNALDSLVSAIRRDYQGETYPPSGIAAALISINDIGNLRSTGTQILNNYGQAYVILGNSGSFTIQDSGLPQSDCVRILKSIPQTGYLSVTVNGSTNFNSFPISLINAQSACSVSSSAGNSLIVQAQ
jgi:hypothetical protein